MGEKRTHPDEVEHGPEFELAEVRLRVYASGAKMGGREFNAKAVEIADSDLRRRIPSTQHAGDPAKPAWKIEDAPRCRCIEKGSLNDTKR